MDWRKGNVYFLFSCHQKCHLCGRGLVATDDDKLAQRVRTLKFHGLGVDAFDRQMQGRKPQAEVVEPGFKYNLSDIHAAIAVVQLSRVEQLNQRRAELTARYRELLKNPHYRCLPYLITYIYMLIIYSWCVLIKTMRY